MALHPYRLRWRRKGELLHPCWCTFSPARDLLYANKKESDGNRGRCYLTGTFFQIQLSVHCVSDNGPQFRSEEFAHFFKMNGVKHIRVAPYRAASNRLAERMIQSFKYQMKASKGGKLSIQQRIANFLLAYRSTTHSSTGRTSAGLFLGRELCTRLKLLCRSVGEN